MTNKIALTASMRSNLLSLQNTQKLFNSTQDHLATGYKVNSAMDNPSSYFTAQALNSRANDLSTLLDSIGQAISTLEVADQGITTLQSFIEQAKSVANNARDTANVPSKATTDNVKFNPDKAKTDKLTDYVNVTAGESFTIRTGDATKVTGEANVRADQKLSDLGFVNGQSVDIYVGDEKYTYNFVSSASATNDIALDSTVQDFMDKMVYDIGRTKIKAEIVDGNLSISTLDNSSLTIRSANATEAHATNVFANSAITGGGELTKVTITPVGGSATEVTLGGAAGTATSVAAAINGNETLHNAGVVAEVDGSGNLVVYDKTVGKTGAMTVAFDAESEVAASAAGSKAIEVPHSSFNGRMGIKDDQKVEITANMTVEDFRKAVNNLDGISADFDTKGHLVIAGEQGDDLVMVDTNGSNVLKNLYGSNVVSATNGSNERAKYAKQFDDILTQVDQLVQDTSYKGINLLNGDSLLVNFNESRTSSLNIKGVTFDSVGLGFTRSANEWMDNASIDTALEQVTKATSLLRAQASEFGQNLSTVQIREDFTQNMINNLQSGADKLTLADMNEEAANMLALQTRQQLATNSLSLANQTAQSVLQLF